MMQVIVGSADKKKRVSDAQELQWEKVSNDELVSLATTHVLFGPAQTFVFQDALSGERGDGFIECAEVLTESSHTFIFQEEKLLKKETDALTRKGIPIEVHKTVKKEYRFDQFGVTAALAAKDRKRLWISLMQALHNGEKSEAIAGLLAWKARQMKNTELSGKLTYMYHDSHRGEGDLALLLERFALTL